MSSEPQTLSNHFSAPIIAEKGILFLGTGDRYREEIKLCVSSIRDKMPDCSITVFSDKNPEINGANYLPIKNPEFGYIDKVRLFLETPYLRTIFLDTDTYLLNPLDELFELLQQFDLLACHEVAREHDIIEALPAAFPELNTGMLAYRRSEESGLFFRDFLNTYEPLRDSVAGDQTAFRLCLYRSKVRVWVLPNEFNCQIRQAGFLGKEVYVLHGRNIDLIHAGQKINSYSEKRVFLPSPLNRGMKVVKYSKLKLKCWTSIWIVLRKLGLTKK